MLTRIFPKMIDNHFRGQRLALWLFVPLLLLRLVIGANSMINTASVAAGADGIPLNTFGAAGAAATVSLFALLGLDMLLIALLGVVALIRYRAMIPLVYLVLLLQLVGNRVLAVVHPLVRAGAATIGAGGLSVGTVISYAMMAAIVAGFALSLIGKGYAEAPG